MGYIFSVTINTYFKRRILARPGLRETVVTGLKVCAQRFGARLDAYCVMPNHVHLLWCTPVDVDFDDFIDRFKQETSLALWMELGRIPIWQPRYYDHALRRAASVPAVARYIWRVSRASATCSGTGRVVRQRFAGVAGDSGPWGRRCPVRMRSWSGSSGGSWTKLPPGGALQAPGYGPHGLTPRPTGLTCLTQSNNRPLRLLTVLSDRTIKEALASRRLGIDPLDEDAIQPVFGSTSRLAGHLPHLPHHRSPVCRRARGDGRYH